jgi:hypothetical protein
MYAPPGALAEAPLVATVVAIASSTKPVMIFLANMTELHVINPTADAYMGLILRSGL